MNNRLYLVLVVLSSLTLLACSNDEAQPGDDQTRIDSTAAAVDYPESQADQPASEREDEPTTALLEDPQALRDAMRDPEQREALMQAMRERRQARREDGEELDRDAMRERMRQRREELMASRDPEQRDQRQLGRMNAQSEWWQDEAMRESLALDDSQVEILNARHDALDTRRAEARQQLAGSQRELMLALENVDRARLLTLIEKRSAASQELQQAELDWWRTMIEQLNDEQLATLAREHSHLLIGRRR